MKRHLSANNRIKMFFHCRGCFDDRPPDQSPSEWSRIEAGWTEAGLQVRCKRCDRNIIHVDFQGQKHPADLSS